MATVYVSPSGSDSNTYVQAQSSATPWLTIGKCETSATTGDTIIVMAGTHTWGSVTFTKNFTIQGQTSDPTLYILNAAGANVTWTMNTANLITSVSNIRFYNNANTGANGVFTCSTGAFTFTFTNCIFDTIQCGNNTYSGLFGGAAMSTTAVCSLTISRCLFINITHAAGGASNGIVLAANTSSTLTISITGCTFYFILGLANYARQIIGYSQAGATLNISIKNCIIKNDTGNTINVCSTAAHVVGTYNDYHNMSQVPSKSGTGNNITSDPLFVDAVNGNFNLRPTSPCIGTGTLT